MIAQKFFKRELHLNIKGLPSLGKTEKDLRKFVKASLFVVTCPSGLALQTTTLAGLCR